MKIFKIYSWFVLNLMIINDNLGVNFKNIIYIINL